MSQVDDFFMHNALALARRGLGQTWPNPSVGAVIVRPGDDPEVLARGWTGAGGLPHAERVALEKLDGVASGCSLYVSLEPCSHHGKTTPCAEAIVEAGISRVVCALEDPDPRVCGRGFSILENAGVSVARGVLAGQARQIAAGHILRVTQSRPFVQLKLATGSDGLVPRGDEGPVWITGEAARAHGHLMRSQADAILVGSGTVAADDPELTCRLPGLSRLSPVRIVMSARGAVKPDSRLVKTLDRAPLWLAVAPELTSTAEQVFASTGIEIIPVPRIDQSNALDPGALLTELSLRGITRLLVEGGAHVASSFYELGLTDEILHYHATRPIGKNGIVPFAGHGIDTVTHSKEYELIETRCFGEDTLHRYQRIQKR